MKNCYKWMVGCVVIALAAFFILPRFGVPLAGASLLIPLLMIGCCVLPMLFMMKNTGEGGGGSCCSKNDKNDPNSKPGEENVKPSSGSCH